MEIMNDIKRLVELEGDAVRQGGKECKDWLSTHKNCSGCPYEVGCFKVVSIGLTLMASTEFNRDSIRETTNRLMASKSVKELKEIPIPEMSY
jgi:hypothetical protein